MKEAEEEEGERGACAFVAFRVASTAGSVVTFGSTSELAYEWGCILRLHDYPTSRQIYIYIYLSVCLSIALFVNICVLVYLFKCMCVHNAGNQEQMSICNEFLY